MGNDRYNAVVVGAGPAGVTAALSMAKNNLSVALIERGKYPGCKNMTGGTIASMPFSQILPEYWKIKDIPLERRIVSDELWLLDNDSAVRMGFTGKKFGMAPYNKHTVLRYKFDRWYADQAIKAGAKLFCSSLAVDLVYHKTGPLAKKVDGVILEGGDVIHADVVILAEGAQAALTQKAGLRKRLKPNEMTLYVKEVLELPAERIEDRFNLERSEGASIGMIGFPTSPGIGKGGIWTNKDSLSVIVGGYLNQISGKGLNPLGLLERFKGHPLVKRLIEGAKPIKYMGHIIPKGGFKKIPTLVDDGIIVVGDAAEMISGRRGMDLAMITGQFAAESVAQACALDRYSRDILASYEERVKGSFFYQNMKKGKSTEAYFNKHQDSDFLITKAMNDFGYKYFEQNLDSDKSNLLKMLEELINMQPLSKSAKDVLFGLQNWGVL
ncbi:MAG: FAD-dependent oxidoreductase [Clostridia bacterium]|jgi:electron transfer flavoprotein-quinone oxidoreductase